MFVNDHVAAYLSRVKSVVPYLQQAHHLEREDMEDEDRQRVVATEDEETLEPPFMFVEPRTDVIHHETATEGREGQ